MASLLRFEAFWGQFSILVICRRESKRLQKKETAPVTLEDVAQAAGVSTATVSRVLNNPDGVRPPLRQAVEAQIARLGYVRHGAARALASRRSDTIGAVIPTLDSAIFAAGVNALEARLRELGYSLFLAVSNYRPDQELAQVRNLVERGIDGLVLVGLRHEAALATLLAQQKVPHVATWAHDPESPYPCVGFDNAAAAAQIGRHLLDLGHRRVAMLAGLRKNNDRAEDRVRGLADAMAERDLSLAERDILQCPYEIAEGRSGAAELLSRPRAERPTAIVCGNDVLALGCLFECRDRGIAVPGEVSVTGFDNLPLAAHISPGLTTVNVPSQEMGRRAAEFLVGRLAGDQGPDKIKMETDLIIRGTTGPVKAG